MANLNKVMLLGRLTRDPELRHTASQMAVATLALAVNRTWKCGDGQRQEETTFVDVTAWAGTAEAAAKYLRKGNQVFVDGRLTLNRWTDNDGKQRSRLQVTAENLQFLDPPSNRPAAPPQGEPGEYEPPTAGDINPEDIPF